MNPRVVVFRLNTRYLQQDGEPPEVSKQIVYYSLAVGHHVGVIDTFKAALSWPYDEFLAWVESLPAGEARRKLEGVRRFGEIMIDFTHTGLLRPVLERAAADAESDPDHIATGLIEQIHDIEREPALYLMMRRVA